MRFIRKFNGFKLVKESVVYSSKNLIQEICVAMVLLNNEFLDNILDKGIRGRYTYDSSIFLTDLKNLILSKNRLRLGKFVDGVCVIDDEVSKVNEIFNGISFDIESEWNLLTKARNIARSIMDKLLDEKLDSNSIKNIFWLGPNKDKENKEDIVVELTNGKQYSFFLDKNLSNVKTASFSKFADDLIGDDINRLFGDDYINRWDKLTQQWVQLIYENVDKSIQKHIEKFIDFNRIESLSYFEYFDIKHGDPKFKHLGEYIPELDRNILLLSDLLGQVWERRDEFFMGADRVTEKWYETKIILLNSKILENLLTTSLKNNFNEFIEKTEGEFKKAEGTVKMKLLKTIIEKMNSTEKDVYYISKSGENFHRIPERDFFRKYYDDMTILFDYHVKFKVEEEDDENNDFRIRIKCLLDDTELIDMDIIVMFTGTEMSGKLSAKYKFNLAPDFNHQIYSKEINDNNEEESNLY